MAKIKEIEELELTKKANKFIESADMSKGKKNRGGRPKKDKNDRATEQIFINVTKDEKAKIDAHAKELGISVSALCKISLAKFI
ncbi:MAG: hypothetical protein GQ570_13365 [Helicobacteraceae bacterium]|nr:hypothetical protein [Helicobacteraceae bacterium]